MSIFEELKKQISLKEVGEMYCSFNERGFCYSPVVLKNEGRQERSPSFTYSDKLGIFKCFSSGWSGDVISFVALMEDLSMKESARFISDKFDLGLDFKDDNTQQIFRANKEVIDAAHSGLTPEARDYLNGRGITDESIELYKLGYLNGRITMPLRNCEGKVAAINQRLLKGSGPKYIHSENSLVFNKSKFLGNLDIAKKYRGRHVIITEGLFDCMQAHQAGYPAVAALSANINKEHVMMLLKYFPGFILAFDSDPTGVKATIKTFKLIKDIDPCIEVDVMRLGVEKDLSDYLLVNQFTDLPLDNFYSWGFEQGIELNEILKIAAVESSAIELRRAAKEIGYYYQQDPEDVIYDIRRLQGIRVEKKNERKFRYT